MNLALLVGSLGLGGAERQCVELAKCLKARGHSVQVIYFTDSHIQLLPELESAGVENTLLKAHFPGDPTVLFRLTRLLRKQDTQVVHSFLFTAGYYGRVGARLARVPVIIHGERNANPNQSRRQVFVDRLLARMTDHFVANSCAGASVLASVIGVSPLKITVIFNGVDLGRFQKADHISPIPVIVSVGRLWPQKNYQTALDAVAICAAQTRVIYWIAGDSGRPDQQLVQYREQLVKRSEREDLAGTVEWLGYRLDVPELLSSADIFLSTSRHEGMPNALLEAMASGLPVVTSNVSDNAKIVRDGVDGFLVEDPRDTCSFAKHLATLLHDPALRRRMGIAARSRIEEEFSVESLGNKHETLYKKLLMEKRPNAKSA